jgi:hypothetical protein
MRACAVFWYLLFFSILIRFCYSNLVCSQDVKMLSHYKPNILCQVFKKWLIVCTIFEPILHLIQYVKTSSVVQMLLIWSFFHWLKRLNDSTCFVVYGIVVVTSKSKSSFAMSKCKHLGSKFFLFSMYRLCLIWLIIDLIVYAFIVFITNSISFVGKFNKVKSWCQCAFPTPTLNDLFMYMPAFLNCHYTSTHLECSPKL